MNRPQNKQAATKKFLCSAAAALQHTADLYERDALAFAIESKFAEGASFTPAAGAAIPASGVLEGLAGTYAVSSFLTSATSRVLKSLATGNYQGLFNALIGYGVGKASGVNGVAGEAAGMAGSSAADALTPDPC